MNYILIRVIVNLSVFIVLILYFIQFFKKAPKSKQKAKKAKFFVIGGILGFLAFSNLLNITPFENLFLSFSTPQDACAYSCPYSQVRAILENDKVAVALYERANDNFSNASFVKEKDGWKMNVPFSPNYGVQTTDWEGVNIRIITIKDQKVVMIESTSAVIYPDGHQEGIENIIYNISDSIQSNFLYQNVNYYHFGKHLYYTFIDQPIDHYSIYINGEEISIF